MGKGKWEREKGGEGGEIEGKGGGGREKGGEGEGK